MKVVRQAFKISMAWESPKGTGAIRVIDPVRFMAVDLKRGSAW
jgi:hypothetical protein